MYNNNNKSNGKCVFIKLPISYKEVQVYYTHIHTYQSAAASAAVWRSSLQLSLSPLPSCVVHLMRSYLSGRLFRVCIHGSLRSVTRRRRPTRILPRLRTGLCAYELSTSYVRSDPLILWGWCHAPLQLGKLRFTSVMLQRQHSILAAEMALGKQYGEFCFTLWSIASCLSLSLEERPISRKRPVKYDQNLTFTDHVPSAPTASEPNCSLSCHTVVVLYPCIWKLFLRAILTYSMPTFWSLLSGINKSRLEKFHLRLSKTSPIHWYIQDDAARTGLKILSLEVCLLFGLSFLDQCLSFFPPTPLATSTDRSPPPYRFKHPQGTSWWLPHSHPKQLLNLPVLHVSCAFISQGPYTCIHQVANLGNWQLPQAYLSVVSCKCSATINWRLHSVSSCLDGHTLTPSRQG